MNQTTTDSALSIIDIVSLAKTVATSCSANSEMRSLANDFQPGPLAVICSRGKTAYNHNKHFRNLVESHLERYSNSESKLEKSMTTSAVVDTVRARSPQGGFVRRINGLYYEVSESIAREKVGGAFRDMLNGQYKSSTKAKKRRHKEDQAKGVQQAFAGAAEPIATDFAGVAEPIASSSEAPKKRQRVEDATPLSHKSATNALCAFEGLLQEISDRREELSIPPSPASLDPKPPSLPPPATFPALIKLSVARGCSVESMLSFDIDIMDEFDDLDEFHIGLARLRSVSSSISAISLY